MKKNNIPEIVIVGKPNVGKSALFNRLANNERALVHDSRGVTRDPKSDLCTWNNFSFKITDTAGISEDMVKDDVIAKKAIIIAEKILKNADIGIVVFDASEELTNEDLYLLNFVKKNIKNYFIIANKSDKKSCEENISFIENITNADVIKISAAHGKGIEDVYEYIKNFCLKLGFKNEENIIEKNFKVSFLGRPNVGKSSLLNALTGRNISIVSEIAGTTRETVSELIEFEDFVISIVDTAGVRRSRKVDERLEELSISNTMRSIERSHIIIAVFDISSDEIYDQDIKLAAHVFQDMHRGMIIVWNKVDLVPAKDRSAKIEKMLGHYKNIFDNVPHLFTSAIENINVQEIKTTLKEVWKNYKTFLDSQEVFYILDKTLKSSFLTKSRQKLDIKKLTVIKSGPLTISLKVNNRMFFEESQLNYLSNVLRKNYNLLGVPIKWSVYQ